MEFGCFSIGQMIGFFALPAVTAASVQQDKALDLHWNLTQKPFFVCVASYNDGVEGTQSILYFLLFLDLPFSLFFDISLSFSDFLSNNLKEQVHIYFVS